MTSTHLGTIDTVGGRFGYLWTATEVLASGWTDDAGALTALVHPSLRPAEITSRNSKPIEDAVTAWADGDLSAIDGVAVRQRGGAYFEQTWDALRTVRGTASYAELAALSGRPAATRAAAGACARNAAALFVPCHRAVRTDGSLGGFRYGLAVKRALLDHERAAA